MLAYLTGNLSTIIVAGILLVVLVLIVRRLRTKGSCSSCDSCSSCPSSGACHPEKHK